MYTFLLFLLMKKPPKRIWVGPVRKPKNAQRVTITKPPEKTQSVSVEHKPSKAEMTNSQNSVDFVLVYSKKSQTEETYSKIVNFVTNLKDRGFELTTTPFSINEDIEFIKIHAPQEVLIHFAEIFGIELAFQNVNYKPAPSRPSKCMATEVTAPQMNGPIFPRARSTLSGLQPKEITNAEKGLIIYKVLLINSFGDNNKEVSIEKLIQKQIFESAYPLHDGPYQWTEEGPLNDRQLLHKYWSSINQCYKQQPLDLIEKYFGPEIGFYFAWLGFYNKMLLPASVIGFLCFILGAIVFLPNFFKRSNEVCGSKMYLCPRCIVKHCKYAQLKNSCFHSYLIYLFDNPLVVTFAALMSIWSTLFLELWRREEALLQIRWNLRDVELDYSMRPEFEDGTKYKKFSKISGTMEPYMPKRVLCCRYTITASVILLLIILMTLGIIGVMIYVKTIGVVLTKSSTEEAVTKNVGLIASATGSLISVAFILTFDLIYHKIAFWLTNLENPRTQVDFDNSYTYKSYAMAFVNNYAVIFYIAFIKGRFYTYPGDKHIFEEMGGLGSDVCGPAGCIVELGIQMVVVLLAKNLIATAKQYLFPQMLIAVKKFLNRKALKEVKVTTQWEEDYLLNTIIKYDMLQEYMQMIIQYGFVTFFVAAFPLAPLLALLNNLFELRVDAFKFTCAFRRRVAHKVANIGAWNGILQGATYIGVATNAFVIAFTSELVSRVIYKTTVRSDMTGFVNNSLSAYNTSEFPLTYQSHLNVSICYYPGKRYPPDHAKRYQLTDEFWFELTMKFLTVVIFEHVVMLITGVIAYAIPDIPFSVKEHINHHREKLREMKMKTLHERYLEDHKEERTDIFAGV